LQTVNDALFLVFLYSVSPTASAENGKNNVGHVRLHGFGNFTEAMERSGEA